MRIVAVPLCTLIVLAAACPGPTPRPAPAPGPRPTPVPEPQPAPEPPPPQAPTPAAMTLAESGIVPEWLDRAADPCQDFYAYACGGFMATAKIPADRSSWSAITVVQERTELFLRDVLEAAAKDPGGDPAAKTLGDYYAACMDEAAVDAAGTTPIAPFLATIAKVKDARSAAVAITELHGIGVHAFFSTWPAQDFADATQVIASLDQAGLGLPDRKYYLENGGSMKAVREAYKAHLGRMFALTGMKPGAVKTAVADVLRIETALAKLQQDKVFRRDPHNVYHRVDRAGLEQAAAGFPWADYFGGIGIPEVGAITVHDPAYYAGVVRLLGKEKPAALRHYLTWMLLHATAEHLGKAFQEEDFALERAISGTQSLPPRWRRCVMRTDEDLGELLGQSFVAARFAGDSKARAVELTRAVFDAMAAELDTLAWMDDATRVAAREKLGTMGALIGYPDAWRRYDFEVRRDDYAGNVLAATRFELGRQLAKIGKPVDRKEWLMTPPTVNAYYDPSMNQMALPAGQLQPPFFGARFHPAVNFGSTGGGTIGHELTHGFDDEGSQFDHQGNLKDWWSPATKKAFGEATQCVVDQYAQYEAVPGVKLNGKLTAGENIADIGGVKLGFLAYRAWRAKQKTPPPAVVDGYTDEQLYFLAYAQSWCAKVTPERLENMAHTNPHSPPMWRVNGVIVDQPGFAEAFQCKAGTPMHPGKTCVVW
jgi:predicted metalloendopeptidase